MESSLAPVGTSEGETSAADRKVLGDLDILTEKMDRCTELLAAESNTGAVPKTHELYDLVGFIEACAPRMVELVEAAAQGVMSDVVLMRALDVNDRLTKLLSTDTEGLSFVDVAAPDSIPASSTEDEFDAFLSERTGNAQGDLM
jgi:hypothetical protein